MGQGTEPLDVAAALASLDARPAPAGPAEAVLVAADRFAVINAAYGRRVGDQVLAATAARIGRIVGERPDEGLVARVGGAAFLAAGGAGSQARIVGALARPFVVDGLTVPVTFSAASMARAPDEPAAAMWARLRVMAGGEGDVDEADDALAADLHPAVSRGEVEVLFQPQVSLVHGRIIGVEALARWEHPRLGTLGAEPLFAAAARAGVAEPLSAHVQRMALARAAAWTGRLAELRLSVNVTPGDLAAPDFADRFMGAVRESGFPPDRLTAEVTEGTMINDLDTAATALADLRAAGCRVALDDFGTGYSSLAWLRALPVDAIKIDRSMTRDVTGTAADRAVLDGIIGIARRLGLRTVAEGVETAEQRDLLATAGCDTYQGFLCAGPLDGAGLAALVERWRG